MLDTHTKKRKKRDTLPIYRVYIFLVPSTNIKELPLISEAEIFNNLKKQFED